MSTCTKRFSPQTILALHDRGMSTLQIALRLKCTKSLVCLRLREAGRIPNKAYAPRKAPTPPARFRRVQFYEDAIRSMNDQGATTFEIASAIRATPSNVSDYMKHLGIKREKVR